MTQIKLADKNSTPQVHGPFHVVLADLTTFAAFAGAPTLFTPASGDVLLAAWCKVTVVAVTDGVDDGNLSINVSDNGDVDFPLAAHGSSSRRLQTTGAVAAGLPVKAVVSGAAYTAGEADLYVLVLPGAS